MTMRRRRRSGRGQSLVEVALVLPLLLIITLAASDLAQAYTYASDVAGASRAGMRAGIQGDTFDIGDAVRSEPNSVVADTVAAWGSTGPAQTYDHCGTSGACGDPNGCPSSAFVSGQAACFAVHACVIVSNQCTTYSSWGVRPESSTSSNGSGLEVVVVYKFKPLTPLMAQFAGSGGALYLTSKTQGLELYY
jgi:Flp pilus assembly protein TadG